MQDCDWRKQTLSSVDILMALLGPITWVTERIERDHPHLVAGCEVSFQLKEHITGLCEQTANVNFICQNKLVKASTNATQTFESKFAVKACGTVVPVYNHARTSAYALHPKQRKRTVYV
jgi:hypothetical protein